MRSGTLLGERFRVGLRLERSRLGAVFAAKDEALDLPCRLELIHCSGHGAVTVAELLAREVAIGERLDQPSLLPALGWGSMGDRGFWVARRVEPGSHPFELRKGGLQKRLFRLLEAAQAVEVLAAMGGAHRNLAPSTVLQGAGTFLWDFSLARLDGVPEPPLDPRGVPLAWLPAAAPELLRAFEGADAQADVYALGALLFNLLTGSWPGAGARLVDALRDAGEIARGLADSPNPAQHAMEAPSELASLCAASLAFAPQDRPDPGTFAGALAKWLDLHHVRVALPRVAGSGSAAPMASDLCLPPWRPERGSFFADRFHIGGSLGQSRHGEVFKGTDHDTFGAFHVEVILRSGELGEELEQLAQREVRVGDLLEGKGIVTALDWGRLDPELLFVARESRGGRPLDLGSGTLVTRVQHLLGASRRLAGLAALGGVHRNLGPLTFRELAGEIALADFSLARFEGVPEPKLEARGPAFSWLPCAAPELLLSFEDAGPAADVFALGVMLFMALTDGQAPYPGPTLAALLDQHEAVRCAEVDPPRAKRVRRGVHPNLDRLSFKALSLDPEVRPSAKAFALALCEWLELEGAPELPVVEVRIDVSAAEATLPLDDDEFDDELEEISPDQAAAILSRLLSASDEDLLPVEGEDHDEPLAEASSRPIHFDFDADVLEPAGLEAHLSDYKFACCACGTPAYLLPPLGPENTACKDCEAGLEPYDPSRHDSLFEVTQQQRAAESRAPGADESELTSSSDSGVVRLEFPAGLLRPAGLETPLGRFRCRCISCGEVAYLLPPETLETTSCKACQGALVSSPPPEPSSEEAPSILQTEEDSDEVDVAAVLEESGEGTGYVQFRRTSRIPPRGSERRSAESGSLEAAVEAVEALHQPKVDPAPAPARRRFRRRRPGAGPWRASSLRRQRPFERVEQGRESSRGPGALALALKLLLWGGLVGGLVYAALNLRLPEDAPVAQSSPPPFDPGLVGHYRLVVGKGGGDLLPVSRSCYLDLSRKERPLRLEADAWRPDDQEVACAGVRASGQRIQLTMRRSYVLAEDTVSEDWRLSGVLERRARVKGRATPLLLRGTAEVVTRTESTGARRVRRYRFVATQTDASRRAATEAFQESLDSAKAREAKVKQDREKEAERVKALIRRGEG